MDRRTERQIVVKVIGERATTPRLPRGTNVRPSAIRKSVGRLEPRLAAGLL